MSRYNDPHVCSSCNQDSRYCGCSTAPSHQFEPTMESVIKTSEATAEIFTYELNDAIKHRNSLLKSLIEKGYVYVSEAIKAGEVRQSDFSK